MKNQRSLLSMLLLASISATALADPPTPPSGKRWEKVENMSDEFNGSSLDASKWAKSDPQWAGRVPGKFKENTISVGGGNLKITNYKLSSPEGAYTHGCGLVRSLQSGLYGYYETRMKASKTFMSSTFWLFNKRNEHSGCDVRTTELDITETVGVNSNGASWVDNMIRRMNSNTHSRQTTCSGTPVGQQGGHADLGGQSWEAYHTYGVWWKSKDELLFYLDNEYKFSITPPADFNLPMYLRMVTETYDWNPVPGDGGMAGSADSRTTYYDWTRTWELVDDNTPVTQQAYPNGIPHAVPGTIEAENFDLGGQDVAYNDADAANNGPNVMRENEGVDIESRDGGNNIGWTANGEWLEYTVNTTGSTYTLEARVAAITTGKSIVAKLDGATLGTFNIPNTGNWGTFQTISINNIAISGGSNRVLRLEFVGGGVNLNWIRFTATGGNNLVQNPGLETGNLNGWSGYGTRQVVSDASSGSYAVKVTGTAGHTQDVTVQPNTQYTLSAKTKAQSGNVILGVKNYGGPEKGNNITSTSYVSSSLTFTTGSSSTSAEIYLYVPNAGSVAFGDEFSVVATASSGSTRKAGNSLQASFPETTYTVLYPNPLYGGNLTLDLKGFSSNVDITVFDTMGKKVYETVTNAEVLRLNAGIFPARGLYIFNIQGPGNIQRYKLLVK